MPKFTKQILSEPFDIAIHRDAKRYGYGGLWYDVAVENNTTFELNTDSETMMLTRNQAQVLRNLLVAYFEANGDNESIGAL